MVLWVWCGCEVIVLRRESSFVSDSVVNGKIVCEFDGLPCNLSDVISKFVEDMKRLGADTVLLEWTCDVGSCSRAVVDSRLSGRGVVH